MTESEPIAPAGPRHLGVGQGERGKVGWGKVGRGKVGRHKVGGQSGRCKVEQGKVRWEVYLCTVNI